MASFLDRFRKRFRNKNPNKGMNPNIAEQRAARRLKIVREAIASGEVVGTAKKYRISERTLRSWAKKAEHKLPNNAERQYRRVSQETWDSVLSLYKDQHRTMKSLENEFGVPAPYIRRKLLQEGIPIRHQGGRPSAVPKLVPHKEAIAEAYNNGKSIDTLAAEYNVNYETMRKYLAKFGVEIRHIQTNRIFANEAYIQEIVRLREEGHSMSAIATMYNTSPQNISTLLRQYGKLL